jgi:hypothetical protein
MSVSLGGRRECRSLVPILATYPSTRLYELNKNRSSPAFLHKADRNVDHVLIGVRDLILTH